MFNQYDIWQSWIIGQLFFYQLQQSPIT